MYDLNGKVALVTGAAGMRGFGRAIAIRLAREGADVVVADHPKANRRFVPEAIGVGWKGLDSVVDEIRSAGRRGLAINTDVTSAADIENVVDIALSEFKRIDILVNNAGIPGPVTPVVGLEQKAWDTVLQVNLTGYFLVSKAVAKHMVQRGQGGKIVMISSKAGKAALVGIAAYSASKAGVISLTQTLALELARYKINVNAVCPGGVPTDINYPVIEKLAKERNVSIEAARELHAASFEANIPLCRLGKVEEIASAVAFLASGESDYITGQAISVDGGVLIGL